MIGCYTVKQGERVAVWNHKGEVRIVDGPRRLTLFRETVQELPRFSAQEGQYLVVRYADGRTEHRRGPVDLWYDPVQHDEVTVENAVPIDAHEALVVYTRESDDRVSRRILRGPAQYVPAANEWLHQFRWHGADPRNPTRKVPRGLQFTKLRVIPDQMYFDVEDVRTADDALVVIKLMIFFELADIERMLDQTHDPVADFINAVSADVIEFVAGRPFEVFKQQTERLNELDSYRNLTRRADLIGYRVNKVVYRGYTASQKLQAMHDHAIESRTELKLEAETESQAQELADLKLAREAERAAKQREIERAHTEHEQDLRQLAHVQRSRERQADHEQRVAFKREFNAVELEHLAATNEEKSEFLRAIQGLQVDLTRYLVAQYQHPDRLIRIDGSDKGQVHLHDQS